MFGRLLPKEGRFFDLFNAHAAQVVRAAHELKALMDKYDSPEEREQHARLVDDAEHAADRITRRPSACCTRPSSRPSTATTSTSS